MILLPAIDLKDQRVVRLYQGSFDTVHQVAEDPLQTAAAFYEAGARFIHMVDLGGAKSGRRVNSDIVSCIARESGLRVELGGGIRSMADLEAVDALGVERMVIGSAAVSDPELVRAAVQRYGRRIAVGIDTRDGRVRTAGWVEDSGLDYLDFARSMEALGVEIIIFTDIAADGALTGPSYDRLAALQRAVKCDIIASGGVSCNEDLARLNGMGLYGAIIGKAYYAGKVDLARAVREVGSPC
ncbi:MAG: 1-(5-phosphoribosyl)-5-[(5-phosphoribosylamino)methylideneamino]imidazole-4-carboxamide isomerase [Clostridiales bacterium]|nr:1-(5-phosphoribosyl)-5-[(5-phosphoribosylamino)methylideneamino]imidazole-4-carboxamide isomerase [Clostridiales bacterium]